MRAQHLILLLVPTVCVVSANGQPGDETKVIIAKAVKAHGGDAKIKRPALSMKLKTVVIASDKMLEASGTIHTQGNNQSRIETQVGSIKIVDVVNGEKGWIREDDVTRVMNADELADAKEDLYTDYVCALTPLLDGGFTLSQLKPILARDRPTNGVRVSKTGHRDVDLYFDSETFLLVKKRFKRPAANGAETEYVSEYEAFKEFDGVKTWTKSVTYRDGKKRFEHEVTEIRFLEVLPAATFAKP